MKQIRIQCHLEINAILHVRYQPYWLINTFTGEVIAKVKAFYLYSGSQSY